MALTIASVRGADHVAGNKKVKIRDITFDATYPAGGEALNPADVGLKVIETAEAMGLAKNAAGTAARPVTYDYTNKKLLAYGWDAAQTTGILALAENNVADISTLSVRMKFTGF